MICLAQETSSYAFIPSPHVLTAAALESGPRLTPAHGKAPLRRSPSKTDQASSDRRRPAIPQREMIAVPIG